MTDTRMLAGHDAARTLAAVVASLRTSPPAGLESLADMPWQSIHSIFWQQGGTDPVIVVEAMRQRQPNGTRTLLRAAIADGHPLRREFDLAVAGVLGERRAATLSVRVMVAFAGWEVSLTEKGDDGDETVTPWSSEESLALTGAEWPDYIVQRDADDRQRGMYAANAMIRVAERLEAMVADHEENYYRHWTRVDAEILRRAALREHPALDPDFVPRIELAA